MIKNLKIIVLSENASGKPFCIPEHGLSFYIEADGKKIIFDTGTSNLFIENGLKLGINLKDINNVVLSHGHYDHTGGLEYLKGKTVYCQPELFVPKYKQVNEEYENIGIFHKKSYYEQVNGLNFVDCEELCKMTDSIKLITQFDKAVLNENYFYIKKGEKYFPDNFKDELAMTINTESGLIIITGCAHSGILNIVKKAIEVNKQKKIYALLGGFHLSKLIDAETKKIAEQLNRYHIEHVGISHCTGSLLETYLLQGNAFSFNTGDMFTLEGKV